MRYLFIILLLVPPLLWSQQDSLELLVGQEFRNINEIPSFEEYRSLGGAMLTYSDSSENYGVFHGRKEQKHLIVFAIIRTIDRKGRYYYQHSFIIPKVNEGELLIYQLCSKEGKHQPFIVALVKEEKEDVEIYEKIIQAWQYHPIERKVVEIDTEKVSCFNETYGI